MPSPALPGPAAPCAWWKWFPRCLPGGECKGLCGPPGWLAGWVGGWVGPPAASRDQQGRERERAALRWSAVSQVRPLPLCVCERGGGGDLRAAPAPAHMPACLPACACVLTCRSTSSELGTCGDSCSDATAHAICSAPNTPHSPSGYPRYIDVGVRASPRHPRSMRAAGGLWPDIPKKK